MKHQLAYTQLEEPTARIRQLHKRLPDRIGVRLAHGIECIRLDQIVCCQAWGNYCKIHLANRETPLLVSKTLKHVTSVLPEDLFFKTHQSFVIRIDAIGSIGEDILLSNGMNVPLSRGQRPEFLSWVKGHITLI